MRFLSVVLSGLLLGGCSGTSFDGDPDPADQVVADALSAASFNHPISSHHAVEVRVASPGAALPLLDREGAPLGPTVQGSMLRITGNEIVRRSGHEALYYMWGNGSESGFVPRHYLASKPDLVEEAGGNGKPAPSNCRTYVVRPRPIGSSLRFARHDGNAPSTLETYGTPGAPAFPGYTTLQWNVVTVDGGGLVRSILRDGERFYASRVRRIRVRSVGAAGSVTFMYGFAFQGGERVYGWTVVSHTEGGRGTNHVELVATGDCH